MTTQSHDEFTANWARQTGCHDQVDPAASDSVWEQMIASDPVGATWGTGVRRAPQVTSWGWNAAVVTKSKTPTLMVTGAVRQASSAGSRARPICRPRRRTKGLRRSGLFLAQRHVGEESPAPFQSVRRMADQRHRKWHASRHAEARILSLDTNAMRTTRLLTIPLCIFLLAPPITARRRTRVGRLLHRIRAHRARRGD